MRNIVIDCTALTPAEYRELSDMLFSGYEAAKRFSDWFYRHVPASDQTNREFRQHNEVMHECMDSWYSISRQPPLPSLV